MSYRLPLPKRLSENGWKVKIRNWERLEPPHVAIMRGTRKWRYNLRDPGFMDREPPPRDVPDVVVEAVLGNLNALRNAWDRMYPQNPIGSDKDGQ